MGQVGGKRQVFKWVRWVVKQAGQVGRVGKFGELCGEWGEWPRTLKPQRPRHSLHFYKLHVQDRPGERELTQDGIAQLRCKTEILRKFCRLDELASLLSACNMFV